MKTINWREIPEDAVLKWRNGYFIYVQNGEKIFPIWETGKTKQAIEFLYSQLPSNKAVEYFKKQWNRPLAGGLQRPPIPDKSAAEAIQDILDYLKEVASMDRTPKKGYIEKIYNFERALVTAVEALEKSL